jgi:hypothetical protein
VIVLGTADKVKVDALWQPFLLPECHEEKLRRLRRPQYKQGSIVLKTTAAMLRCRLHQQAH